MGVTCNLDLMQLEIKSDRKEDLSSAISSILSSELLDPGTSKLMFGASQLCRKGGRAYLRNNG